MLGGEKLTCRRGCGVEFVQALVTVAAPLLLHKLQRVSRGDLREEVNPHVRRHEHHHNAFIHSLLLQIVLSRNLSAAGKRTFVQLQSMSKAKRKHTWDIPLMLGGWGSVGTRTQRRTNT